MADQRSDYSAEQVVSVPQRMAAEIAEISSRKIAYWVQQQVAGPSVVEPPRPDARPVKLYGYNDLLALLIASELQGRGVSLQHIRSVTAHLRERGYARPLTELEFATVGKQLYFRHPDGSWEGGLRPDQVVLHQVLNLEPLHRRIREGIARDRSKVGLTERRRGALGSKELVAGTRVPVDTVRRYLQAGRSAAQIVESFPGLTPADVTAVAQAS